MKTRGAWPAVCAGTAAGLLLAAFGGEAACRLGLIANEAHRAASARAAAPRGPRVLVLGDSFLADNQGLDRLLRARVAAAGGAVLNLSRGGARPADHLAALRRHGARFKPTVVLLGRTVANDTTDTLWRTSAEEHAAVRAGPVDSSTSWLREHLAVGLRRRQARRAAERLLRETSPPGAAEAVNPYLALSAALRPDFMAMNLSRSEPAALGAWEADEKLYREARAAADALGARLLLVALPAAAQVDAGHHAFFARLGFRVDRAWLRERVPQERLAALCRREGLDCADLLPAFRAARGGGLFLERDDHYSPRGEALADAALGPRLEAALSAGRAQTATLSP